MGQNYEPVTLGEMQAVLSSQGEWEETLAGSERMYVQTHPADPRVKIKLYSSIPSHMTISRDCGKDAIRLALIFDDGGKGICLGKPARTYRVPGWDRRLAEKIGELREKMPDVIDCDRPGCGGIMVKRKGRNGPFYGCSNYKPKNCRNSFNADEVEGWQPKPPADQATERLGPVKCQIILRKAIHALLTEYADQPRSECEKRILKAVGLD